MKKTIYYLTVAAFAASSFLTSCQSPEAKVEDAKQDLKEAQTELNAEYPAFKTNAEAQIAENTYLIKEILSDPSGEIPVDAIRRQAQFLAGSL